MADVDLYFVRVHGVLYGEAVDLETARRNAAGHLLSRRGVATAEVVPFLAGAVGGVGSPVAIARKNRANVIVWSTP